MKLSEAIRSNGMMKPQGIGRESMVSPDAPCALGGALQSIGIQSGNFNEAFRAIAETWKFTLNSAKCPCGVNHAEALLGGQTWIERVLFPTTDSIACIIIFLSDYHKWTRNQIAAWVETVEPAEEVEQGAALPSGPPRVAIR